MIVTNENRCSLRVKNNCAYTYVLREALLSIDSCTDTTLYLLIRFDNVPETFGKNVAFLKKKPIVLESCAITYVFVRTCVHI